MRGHGCPQAGDPESDIREPGQLYLRVSRICVLWQKDWRRGQFGNGALVCEKEKCIDPLTSARVPVS